MINLTFPYTWSNSKADSQIVLANALLRPRFSDLVTLTRQYGADALIVSLNTLTSSGELSERTATETKRMLRNIASGVQDFERAHPSL